MSVMLYDPIDAKFYQKRMLWTPFIYLGGHADALYIFIFEKLI
jgi:hypothetical protein